MAKEAGDVTGLKRWMLSDLMEAFIEQCYCVGKLQGLSICELGSGVHPAVSFLLKRNCADLGKVLVSDYSAEALDLVRSRYSTLAENVLIETLDWSFPVEKRNRHAFDVIVGCEILYYQVDTDNLMRAISDLLTLNTGIMLLASFLREITLKSLLESAKKNNLNFRMFDLIQLNEILQNPICANGWFVFAVFQHQSGLDEERDKLIIRLGLKDLEISTEEQLREEEKHYDESQWTLLSVEM